MAENWNAKQIHEHTNALLVELENAKAETVALRETYAGKKIIPMKPYLLYTKHYDLSKDNVLASIEQDFLIDEQTYLENVEAAKNNVAVVDSITKLLSGLGLPKEIYSWKRNKRVSEPTPWMLSMASVPKTAGTEYKMAYQALKRRIEERATQKRMEQEKRDRELASEQKKNELIKFIGGLESKYGAKFETAEDAKTFLLGKDKYLRLAYWLNRNRDDWNDGSSYAEIGLSEFTLDSDTDKEISEELWGYIKDWDGDGRVFRDCTWNYSVIYGMADQAILADFDKLMEMNPDY